MIEIKKILIEESLRKNISIIRQEPFIFNRSIKDNFKLINSKISLSKIKQYSKIAYLDDYIMSLPKGYDTVLGESGINLSGGQKQRLCIARALLKKPKILILDDSTSAVDTKTDATIRAALQNDIASTTKIIIAQRISSIEASDKIIVLDDGKIDAIGTHDELKVNNAIYREVYESQVKGADDNE